MNEKTHITIQNRSLQKTTLAIIAHCDDLELGAGGTVAKLTKEGWEIHVIVLDSQPPTKFSSNETVNNDHLELLETREKEAKSGAKVLGISGNNILFIRASEQFGDGTWNNRQIVSQIHRYCDEKFGTIKPQFPFIITHTQHDRHQQHVLANAIAGQGFKVPFLCFKVGSSTKQQFYPTVGVNISDYINVKEDAFKEHRSQLHLCFSDGTLALSSIRKEASLWSGEVCFEYGELFECELTESISLDQILSLLFLFDSKHHFGLFLESALSAKPNKIKQEWTDEIQKNYAAIFKNYVYEKTPKNYTISLSPPCLSARNVLASGRFPNFFDLTPIDGCIEIFATPNDTKRYSGYTKDQVFCDISNDHWNPFNHCSEPYKVKDLLHGYLNQWLNQTSHPKIISTLNKAPLTPLSDRQEIRLTFGTSDYFTVRTITQIIKTEGISKLAEIFPSDNWWSDSDTKFAKDTPPYHVSSQVIILNFDPSNSTWSLLLTSYRGAISPIAGGVSVGIAEQMNSKSTENSSYWWKTDKLSPSIRYNGNDTHIFDNATRGIEEELGLSENDYSEPIILNASLETDMFFITFLFLIKTRLTPIQIYNKWHSAPDRDESACLALYPLTVGEEIASNESQRNLIKILSESKIKLGQYVIPTAIDDSTAEPSSLHHSSRMRLYVLGQHLWPSSFSNYVSIY